MPSVSIVIPCKDEKGNIEALVRRVPDFAEALELIFVDGRSTDGTREEILRLKDIFPEKNIRLLDQTDTHGKGPAVRMAFETAQNDILIILDADLTIAPEDMRLFYDELRSGPGRLASGTRFYYPIPPKAMRFLNYWGNRFFSKVISFIVGQKITDTLCGTKALWREDYEKIAVNRSIFGDFDPFGDFDLLFGAAYLKLKIHEIKLRYLIRMYGVTKIHRFSDGLLLLKICWIAMRKLR